MGSIKAYSLLDFPGEKSGWLYGSLGRQGEFEPVTDATAGQETPYGGTALRANTDQYCLIGRDLWHPGHEYSPALLHTIDTDGYYKIEVSFAPLISAAPGSAKAVIHIGDQVIELVPIRHGQILKAHIGRMLSARTDIMVVFRAVDSIDNLRCWYEARIEGPFDLEIPHQSTVILDYETNAIDEYSLTHSANEETEQKAQEFEKIFHDRTFGAARFFSVK